MERDAHFQSLLLHIAQSPQKRRNIGLLIQQNLTFLSESLIKEPPSMFSQRGPCGEILHLQSQWFIYSSI
jgi:hypothetical protein